MQKPAMEVRVGRAPSSSAEPGAATLGNALNDPSASPCAQYDKPLILHFLAFQGTPAASNPSAVATSLPAPLLPTGGPFLELSPRRRLTAGDTATPLSPWNQQQPPTDAAASGAVGPLQTPMPTPPTGLPLSLPPQSNSATPTGSTLSIPTSRTLFFQSLQEVEPPRYSQRSGRVLGELESLHQKHEPEFKILVPAIGNAIKATMDAHERLITEAGGLEELQAAIEARHRQAASSASPPRANGASLDDKMAFYQTVAPPSISIQAYVKRIADFCYLSPATLLSAVILVDRLLERFPTLLLTPFNVFKIFFVAARITSKVLDLRSLNNKNFASVGGVGNQHLNDLEAKMLLDLRFDLFISQELFVRYAKKLMPPQGSGHPLFQHAFFSVYNSNNCSTSTSSQRPSATSPRTSRPLAQVTFAVPPQAPAPRRVPPGHAPVDNNYPSGTTTSTGASPSPRQPSG